MKTKKLWGRICSAISAGMCLATMVVPVPVQAEQYWPEGPAINTPSAIVLEVNTGTILYEKNADEINYPASITKILTTYLVLENSSLDETVIFSPEAVEQGGGDSSSIWRDVDEELTMEQTLYGVMLESANECAYAAAEHVGDALGGGYQAFIDLMNETAEELGCTNSHFNNSNGLPDENHYTTAHDMALIAAEAYKNEDFRIITGTKTYAIPPTNKHPDETTYMSNHHKMLHYYKTDKYVYDYCTGGKTGYTSVAKNTLVTYAEKDNMTLVCVVMHADSPDHWENTRELLDYCFNNFQTINISENETSITEIQTKDLGVLNTNEPFVTLDEDAYIVLPKTAVFEDAAFSINTNDKSDGKVAALQYEYADRVVGSVEIVTTGARVEKTTFPTRSQMEDTHKVVRIRPLYLLAGLIAVLSLVAMCYFGKHLYDNFYVIKHKMEIRREQRARFKQVRRKKGHSRRKRDRMFK